MKNAVKKKTPPNVVSKNKIKKVKVSHDELQTKNLSNINASRTSMDKKAKIVLGNILSQNYVEDSFREKIVNCFQKKSTSLIEASLVIINDPFNCAFLPNFFENEQLLTDARKELETLTLIDRSNDLYQFKGTEELQNVHLPNVDKICRYLKGPIRDWLKQITGIDLSKKVSISSSKYDYTDVLLCHNDELQGRRIAFVLYLVSDPWNRENGGSLDLFSVDKFGNPNVIKRRLYPEFNSLVFFEVSELSFHQVSEILVKDRSRLSINGWFYGEPLDYPQRYRLLAPIFLNPCNVEEHLVYSWINPLYIETNTQKDIRKEFHDKSEIQLGEFLKIKKYKLLCEALCEEDMWQFVGPPIKKNYNVAKIKKYPSILNEYTQLMRSEVMVLILSQLTGLQLHRMAPEVSDSDESSDSEVEDSHESTSLKVDSDHFCNEESEIVKNRRKKGKLSGKKNEALKDCGNKEMILDNLGKDGPGLGGLCSGWSSHINRRELKDMRESVKNGDEIHKAEVTWEVRQWDWGSYSLMRDDDLLNNNGSFILDAMLFCNVNKKWKEEYGGGVVYVAKGEIEELLTIVPSSNSLALVYRDEKTFQFTKFINEKSKNLKEKSKYYEIYSGYRENRL